MSRYKINDVIKFDLAIERARLEEKERNKTAHKDNLTYGRKNKW